VFYGTRRDHKFYVVAGFACSDYPKSYVGGDVTTGRASNASQFKSDDQEKKRISRSYSLAGGRGAENSLPQNICSVQNLLKLDRKI
jgi:hypothetical protein